MFETPKGTGLIPTVSCGERLGQDYHYLSYCLKQRRKGDFLHPEPGITWTAPFHLLGWSLLTGFKIKALGREMRL